MQPLYERHPVVPNWRQMQLGGTMLRVICDGIGTFAGLPPLMGANRPVEEVEELAVSRFLDVGRLYTNLNIFIVQIGPELVVFDTGIGALGRGAACGLLASSLREAGVSPGDVTLVCLTHLHADHICGLLEDGEPLFPDARYVMGRVEYDFWTSDAAATCPRPETIELVTRYVTPLLDRSTLVEDEQQVAPGIVARVAPGIVARAAFGHSPGHLMYEVETGAGPLMIVGDALLHPVSAFERPEWHSAFDAAQRLAAETRMRLLEELAERRIPFAAFHLPLPGLGFVGRTDGRFSFVPATYQFV